MRRLAWPLFDAVAGGAWRHQPGRVILAVLGIACGVALGVAVHLINTSASNELELAVRSLAGEADVLVRGSRSGFPDSLYARIARLDGVLAASPAVELDAQLAGRRETIRVLGLDPFRARDVQPHLLAEARDALLDLLKGDAVLLSRAAADDLALRAGDTLRLQAGTRVVALRVAEVLPAGATRQRLAIMDIASAQWRLERLGELHRIDIKLAPGTSLERFRERAAVLLPPGVLATTPDVEARRSAGLARAYRVNLDMLAVVALLTGAFLVFSTQFLSLLRRRTQLALLRVVGLTRARLTGLLVAEGALVGIAGSALGIVIGYVLASAGIRRFGGDLGAGYFRSVTPELDVSAAVLVAYFALGVAFAALGAAVPALEASRRLPALALKAGDEEAALQRFPSGWAGLALVAAGLVLSQAPPVHGLPVFGYVAIALMLVGTVLAMPRFAEWVLSRMRPPRYAPAALAAAQLQGTSRQAAISLAAIVASFSLMVSMVIMTGSFRVSLEAWLDQMLPADVYVRAGRIGETGFFTREDQARLAALDGVGDAVFVRAQNVLLLGERPAVTLIARPFVDGRPRPAPPLEGPEIPPPAAGPPPAWISEVAADLLHLKAGDALTLPIGEKNQPFTVAGIWRDYARQNGAVIIDRGLYTKLTGDDRANEAALYIARGATFEGVAQRIRAAFDDAEGIEIASTRELKAISLAIFDRTFAVTYALEAAAVLIGLFGVSASFSAQALARRREFGVLRHIGMTRRRIAAMLGCEGFIVGALGVAVGLALGGVISLVLIHVINRQSFHWSMDIHPPWLALSALAAALVAAASLTAVAGGRRAMSDDVTRAVREDW